LHGVRDRFSRTKWHKDVNMLDVHMLDWGQKVMSCTHIHTPSTISLLQVLSLGLLVDDIEQRLRAEPPSRGRANSPIRIRRLFLTNLDGLLAARAGCCFSHELALAALVQRDEPEDGLQRERISIRSGHDWYVGVVLTSSIVLPTVNRP